MLAMKPHYEELHEKYGPTMRTADVAQVLNMHPSHVRALCQQGDLPCVRIGSRMVPECDTEGAVLCKPMLVGS